jgi:hypothetical protein
MKNKATHIGTCQLCGCTQMLPNGRLAKHGYQVHSGWGFVGTCRGSHEVPFEQSCEYTKEITADAEISISKYDPAADPRPTAPANLPNKGERFCNPEELAILKAWQAVIRPWNERQNNHRNLKAFVAFQKPRIAGWSVKPLTARAEEQTAKSEAVKRKADIRTATAHVKTAKRDLSRLLDSARDLGYRFQNERVMAKDIMDYHNNTAFYTKANKDVDAKCKRLSGNHSTALKVAANIRSLFNDEEALTIASDIELAHSLLLKAHAEYAALAA